MALDLGNYRGREQAFVKHHFLDSYLERLIFKTASAYREIVYVDGFSGPWQNRDERFEDTSFGIALRALTLVKKTWATMKDPAQRRLVKMTAHLVERNAAAFSRLSVLQQMFPDIEIVPHQGDFTQIAPQIAKQVPQAAFSFVLIDPKGWSVDLEAIRPLIARENCEVVFNFMFDFINRFALSDDPVISSQLEHLIPGRDWRSAIRAVDQGNSSQPASHTAADGRKAALVEEFKQSLAKVGRYRFVSDIDVLRPEKERTLYFLVYATRLPPGIEVFRDCQISALEMQSEIRGKRKIADFTGRSGQLELLSSTNDMGPDRSSISLKQEKIRARDLMRSLVPDDGCPISWGALWPAVLSHCVIRLVDLKRLANEDRKAGILVFPTWPSASKRVPEDNYIVLRGKIGSTRDLFR